MRWHLHSDKWSDLNKVQYRPGFFAIDAFNPSASVTQSEKIEAIKAIIKDMDQKRGEDLACDVLHASTMIFLRHALDASNETLPLDEMIGKAFERTAESPLKFYSDLKRGILMSAFSTAQEEEPANSACAIKLFDTLSATDPVTAKDVIECYLPEDQEWEVGTSIGPIISSLKL